MRSLLTLWFCMFSIAAHAEVDLNSFLENYDRVDTAEKHHLAERLLDMQYGMAWTNAVMEAETGTQLYCPPQTLTLTGEQLGSRLIKSTIPGRQRGKSKPDNCAPVCHNVWRRA